MAIIVDSDSAMSTTDLTRARIRTCDVGNSASTTSHQVGVRAIVEQLGGFSALMDESEKEIPHMLLSEFASTDLTRALLDARPPCFPARIWLDIERGPVWWEKQTYGITLAAVFRTMAQLAFYHQSIQNGDEELDIEKVRDFESLRATTEA
ncbi:hypothetical protein PoHVEF18_000350 [Penicillium ochrochloron]